VPGACRFAFEFRTLPGQDAAALLAEVQAFADSELLPAMRARHPGAAIAWRELMSYPALGSAAQSGFERLCCELAGGGAPRKVAFGTEAGLFAARGIASVVCGPGDIAVAHQPDEYVELAELERCTGFLRRLIDRAVAA
jgi:acetylornithine deacetylase